MATVTGPDDDEMPRILLLLPVTVMGERPVAGNPGRLFQEALRSPY